VGALLAALHVNLDQVYREHWRGRNSTLPLDARARMVYGKIATILKATNLTNSVRMPLWNMYKYVIWGLLGCERPLFFVDPMTNVLGLKPARATWDVAGDVSPLDRLLVASHDRVGGTQWAGVIWLIPRGFLELVKRLDCVTTLWLCQNSYGKWP